MGGMGRVALEGGRILVTIHGIQFQEKSGQAGNFFFRISLLNTNKDPVRNCRQKTKVQKVGDAADMVPWVGDTPSHFSFQNGEVVWVRVTLILLRKKLEKTIANVDISAEHLHDDRDLRRNWRLDPKHESGISGRIHSTVRFAKCVCVVDMSIKYETDRTSVSKGAMVSYVNLNQQIDQVKSRKKLEKKGKKEEFALQTDEVVVGSFRCIWGKMRGELYLSTRRLMFLSDGLMSRGKSLQIFWSQVDHLEKKKSCRGVQIQTIDERIFLFEGFLLKLNKVFIILCTLRSQYMSKKNKGSSSEVVFDEDDFGDEMIDAEVKEPELDGEYVDEILEDLADEAATNSYLAPSEAESLRGEHSIIDKLKLDDGEDWKAIADTIGSILEEEAIKRKKEHEHEQEKQTSDLLFRLNLPAEEEPVPHFGRLPFHEGDEAVFELMQSEKRGKEGEGGEGGGAGEGGLWVTTKLHLVTFVNVFPVVVLLSYFNDQFRVARIMDAVVFSLFLVFTAPVMFFVMRTLTASVTTLVLAKARDGVVDKHTDVLSNVILPYILTPLWYIMLVGGVCVMLEGVHLEGICNSLFVTALLSLSLSSTISSWSFTLKDFIQKGKQKQTNTNAACWKQLRSRFGEEEVEGEEGEKEKGTREGEGRMEEEEGDREKREGKMRETPKESKIKVE